jgi:5-methylthioadenosine/S-adenosylhomocysteine deaminase
MQGGVIPGVDFASLRNDAQAAAEQIWQTVEDWDPLGRTHEEACPWSYPMAQ